MSNEFLISVGMESHARLVSEWAHYKSWAETQSDEVESLRRQLAALRRGLQQLVGAPELPPLSDAELFTLLGEVLDRAVDDRHVEYRSRPDGPVELTVDVSALRQAPVVMVPAPPGIPIASYEDFPVRAPGESPWLAPGTTVVPAGQSAMIAAAEQAERERQWEAGETRPDGTHALFQPDPRPAGEQDGPATESMPPVEEPPAVPDGYVLGRVFTRDTVDGIDWDNVLMPSDLVSRVGDWWEFVDWPDGQPGLNAVFTCNALKVNHMLREVLHVHGTVWEVVRPDAVGEQVSGE